MAKRTELDVTQRTEAVLALLRREEPAVLAMARANPWYGYKRIAVMCRREAARHPCRPSVTNRQCYRVMKQHDLLLKPLCRAAELYQAAKLWQLLPQGPTSCGRRT